ncbi:MAG: ASCH domain-containing protein [Nitrospirae bacterium]|nr:ASCH domain-containing protein [Candidatus Manganitrophaceae bacterium]
MSSPQKLWHEYIATLTQINLSPKAYTSWHFGDSKNLANELLALVLAEKKQATASALWVHEHEGETIPKPGDFSVITNWAGEAKCILLTSVVEIIPFNEVTEAFASLEGEGDLSLKFWRKAHWDFFKNELARYGRQPSLDMPIVCERFECVYPLGLNMP